jgi:hypothetical protein
MIDEEIVFREVDIDQLYLPSHMIMTTWHESTLKEAIWDVMNVSFHGSIDIDKVVFLDLTNNSSIKQHLEELAK